MFLKRSGAVSWLVVFLGNPGTKYEFTRHNAGFITADAFEKSHNLKINRSRFKALTATCNIGSRQVMLMKPQTFMNLSGDAVKEAVKFYKIPPENVIVVSDEMSLPVGRIRVREKGSAGGHNGLKSIIAALGTDAFPRIRLGVGSPVDPNYDIKDWVLSTFKDQDAVDMLSAAQHAAEAVEYYINYGPQKTMNIFNQSGGTVK